MVKKLTGPNTAGQTLNPVVPYLMSESLEGSAFPAWLTTAHFSLLGWFHPHSAALPGKYSTTLASPASWGLQGNSVFTFTSGYSGPPYRDSDPATWCQAPTSS